MIRPFLTLFLTIATLLAANAVAQDVFDGNEREVWTEAILNRFERANRVVLNRTEAVVQGAKNRAALERIVNKKHGWKKELTELIFRLDAVEQRAVKLLARKYRIQVYQTFRSQREVLVQRHAAWKLVVANWKADGSPKYQRNKLVDWLLTATAASTPGSVTQLPPIPKFEAKALEVLATLPKKLGIRVHPTEAPLHLTEAPLAHVLPLNKKVEIHEPTSRMTVRPKTASKPMTQTVPKTNVPHRKLAEHKPMTLKTGSVKSIKRRPAVLTPMEKQIELKTPTAIIHRGKQKPTTMPNVEGERKSDVVGPKIVRTTDEPLPIDERRPDKRRLKRTLIIDHRSNVPSERLLAGSTRTTSVMPLDQKSPVVPDPVVPDPVVPDPVVPDPVVPDPVERDGKTRLPSVGVNLDELTARIAGNNMAIRTLESKLYTRTDWNVDQLASLVERLKMLVVRNSDLTLFCELISPTERSLVGQLDSPKSLIDELSAIILKTQARVAGDRFVGTPAERQAVLDRLEGLSGQLSD